MYCRSIGTQVSPSLKTQRETPTYDLAIVQVKFTVHLARQRETSEDIPLQRLIAHVSVGVLEHLRNFRFLLRNVLAKP